MRIQVWNMINSYYDKVAKHIDGTSFLKKLVDMAGLEWIKEAKRNRLNASSVFDQRINEVMGWREVKRTIRKV